MKKWYRSKVTKLLLIVISITMMTTTLISILWFAKNLPSGDELFFGESAKKYEDSKTYANVINQKSYQILEAIDFEKNIKKTDDALVDIKEYAEKRTVSDNNESGFSYSLEEIRSWYQKSGEEVYFYSNFENSLDEQIMVCMNPDHTYYYTTVKDLIERIRSKELRIEKWERKENVESLEDQELQAILVDEAPILIGEDDEIAYSDYWSYDAMVIKELYPPKGYDSILDMANKNSQWNGKLEEAYSMLEDVITSLGSRSRDYEESKEIYREGNTNLTYLYYDKIGKKVYTNKAVYEDAASIEENLDELKNQGKYIIVCPRLQDFESNIEDAKAGTWTDDIKNLVSGAGSNEYFIFGIALDTNYPIADPIKEMSDTYQVYYEGKEAYETELLVSIVIFLICIIWLTFIAGRVQEDEDIHLHLIDQIPIEVAAVIAIGSIGFVIRVLFQTGFLRLSTWRGRISYGENIFVVVLGMMIVILGLIGYLSFVRRIKGNTVWKNSLICRIIILCKGVFRHFNVLWRSSLIFFGFILIHWLTIGTLDGGIMPAIMLVAEALMGIYVLRLALGRAAIYKGIKEIAGGNLERKIPLTHLKNEQLEIAKNINNIGDGFERAVEVSLKSERMKTDLITNVSHDIKTPLTSIINYIELLKRETYSDPKIMKYLTIIDEKSQRLKHLTEDVVEASKVSSGNVKLELVDLNFAELIRQVSGEFAQRMEERGLQEILKLPEHPIVIRVDSKKTWRILENIYTNVTKYAMPGTRVYADTEIEGNQVIFNLKNISEEELNITSDELTERFIRGDEARTKEGSGLGLSIAKSLTELLGGDFFLTLDGDLFKVSLRFPLI